MGLRVRLHRGVTRLAPVVGVVAGLVLASLPAAAQVSIGGNGIYEVAVDAGGDYTARTGLMHPDRTAVNVFFGGSGYQPGTTWNSVRSYRSNDEWVLMDWFLVGPTPSPGFTCASADDVVTPTITPLRNAGGTQTGVQHVWRIQNSTDNLRIKQEVNVEGTTWEDSVVRVTTCVENLGTVTAPIGIRFMWDWEISTQDGPYMGIRPPSPPLEPYLDTEDDWPSPTFDNYEISNTQRPSMVSPFYRIGGTVNRPRMALGPTAPELVQFVSWPRMYATCFEYGTTGIVCGNDDSAVAYYWGATPATAIQVAPGATYCATQYVFVYTDDPPALCSITPSLVGGTRCDSNFRLNASGSRCTDCVGPLEYRFLDPSGLVAEDWSTDAYHLASETGLWTVLVRCRSDPRCTESATAYVRVDWTPQITRLTARDVAPCNTGVTLDWDVNFRNEPHAGTFRLYRSFSSCADATLRPPIVTGLTATSYFDGATTPGATCYYVLEAEDSILATICSPQGPNNHGPIARMCGAPTVDEWSPDGPAGPCWTLNVSHVGDVVTLDWSGSRPLGPGEHFHVLKAVNDPRAAFAQVDPEGDVAFTWTETDPTPRLHLFDIRIANECEGVSADDEPPGYDSGTCP